MDKPFQSRDPTSPGYHDGSITTTIVIPTYSREQVLVDTIAAIRAIALPDTEILVVDQTVEHAPEIAKTLEKWNENGTIRLATSPKPNIPAAMNVGLAAAHGEIVVFLDDDIVPEAGLIEAHMAAHQRTNIALVAGRVIQPWQEGADFLDDTEFHFASTRSALIDHFMGGNFSIRRDVAIGLGGFDENFVRVAYNFEAEFAYRLLKSGHQIYFEPGACVHHLKVSAGGTRSFGEHLTTWHPDHAVGAYYYILRTWHGTPSLRALFWRPLRAVATRHHLLRPWWILLTLIGEIRGFFWALVLLRQGPAYIIAARVEARR